MCRPIENTPELAWLCWAIQQRCANWLHSAIIARSHTYQKWSRARHARRKWVHFLVRRYNLAKIWLTATNNNSPRYYSLTDCTACWQWHPALRQPVDTQYTRWALLSYRLVMFLNNSSAVFILFRPKPHYPTQHVVQHALQRIKMLWDQTMICWVHRFAFGYAWLFLTSNPWWMSLRSICIQNYR